MHFQSLQLLQDELAQLPSESELIMKIEKLRQEKFVKRNEKLDDDEEEAALHQAIQKVQSSITNLKSELAMQNLQDDASDGSQHKGSFYKDFFGPVSSEGSSHSFRVSSTRKSKN